MRRLAGAFVMAVMLASLLVAVPCSASPSHGVAISSLPTTPAFDGQPCQRPVAEDPTCPAWNRCSHLHSCTGDAPDPTIAKAGQVFVAVTTGTALGNNLQVLESTSPTNGYHGWATFPCSFDQQVQQCPQRYGATAFGPTGQGLASYAIPGTQTSPALAFIDGVWHLYFDTLTTVSKYSCLAVAVLNPLFAGPGRTISIPSSTQQPIFVPPVGQSAPLRCSTPPAEATATGLVDPSVVDDPSTSSTDLLYKANDGSSTASAYLFSQRLSADGLHLTGPATVLLSTATERLPWESTIENPSMVEVDGAWLLLFSAGLWYRAGYSEAVATCQSPAGPCTQPTSRLLRSYGDVAGPGGGSFFEAAGQMYLAYAGWLRDCIGYQSDPHGTLPAGCSDGARHLFVTPVTVW